MNTSAKMTVELVLGVLALAGCASAPRSVVGAASAAPTSSAGLQVVSSEQIAQTGQTDVSVALRRLVPALH